MHANVWTGEDLGHQQMLVTPHLEWTQRARFCCWHGWTRNCCCYWFHRQGMLHKTWLSLATCISLSHNVCRLLVRAYRMTWKAFTMHSLYSSCCGIGICVDQSVLIMWRSSWHMKSDCMLLSLTCLKLGLESPFVRTLEVSKDGDIYNWAKRVKGFLTRPWSWFMCDVWFWEMLLLLSFVCEKLKTMSTFLLHVLSHAFSMCTDAEAVGRPVGRTDAVDLGEWSDDFYHVRQLVDGVDCLLPRHYHMRLSPSHRKSVQKIQGARKKVGTTDCTSVFLTVPTGPRPSEAADKRSWNSDAQFSSKPSVTHFSVFLSFCQVPLFHLNWPATNLLSQVSLRIPCALCKRGRDVYQNPAVKMNEAQVGFFPQHVPAGKRAQLRKSCTFWVWFRTASWKWKLVLHDDEFDRRCLAFGSMILSTLHIFTTERWGFHTSLQFL